MVNPEFKYFVDNLPIIFMGCVILFVQWRNAKKIEIIHQSVNSTAKALADQKIADGHAAIAATLSASKDRELGDVANQAIIDDLRRQLSEAKSRSERK